MLIPHIKITIKADDIFIELCAECGKPMIIKYGDIGCIWEEDYIYYSEQYFCCDKCKNDYYNE